MSTQLKESGLVGVTISAQSNHSDARDVIHFATMHRAKGLEFDDVIVVVPRSYLGNVEETQSQRRLLYVALTRARSGVMLLTIH